MLFGETGQQLDIVGRVADFCPICRDLRPFTFRKEFTVRILFHLHFIPRVQELESKETGWDRVCETCNIDLPAFPAMYAAILQEPELGLDDLIRRTNPGLRERVGARLAVEEDVRAGKAPADRRRDLLLEPFYLLEHRVRQAMGPPPNLFERWVLPLAALSSFGGLFLIPLLPEGIRGTAGTTCGVLLLVWVILLLRRGIRALNRKSVLARVVRLEVQPLLGRALKPLRPSAGELAELLHQLRSERMHIGRVAQRDSILAEMDCVK